LRWDSPVSRKAHKTPEPWMEALIQGYPAAVHTSIDLILCHDMSPTRGEKRTPLTCHVRTMLLSLSCHDTLTPSPLPPPHEPLLCPKVSRRVTLPMSIRENPKSQQAKPDAPLAQYLLTIIAHSRQSTGGSMKSRRICERNQRVSHLLIRSESQPPLLLVPGGGGSRRKHLNPEPEAYQSGGGECGFPRYQNR
jgi:hypothetical protein